MSEMSPEYIQDTLPGMEDEDFRIAMNQVIFHEGACPYCTDDDTV